MYDIKQDELIEFEFEDFSIYYSNNNNEWYAEYYDKDVFEDRIIIDENFEDDIEIFDYILNKQEFEELKKIQENNND